MVAYDIADNRRRNFIAKVLEKYGIRINYSVYECMFTETQMRNVQKKLIEIVVSKEDTVTIYPLCVDCFSKAVYIPCRPIADKLVLVR